jgi:hypothetical protein
MTTPERLAPEVYSLWAARDTPPLAAVPLPRRTASYPAARPSRAPRLGPAKPAAQERGWRFARRDCGHGASSASSVAARVGGGTSGAMGDETLAETRAIHPPRGRPPLDAAHRERRTLARFTA